MQELIKYIKNPQEYCSYTFNIKTMFMSVFFCLTIPLACKLIKHYCFLKRCIWFIMMSQSIIFHRTKIRCKAEITDMIQKSYGLFFVRYC